MAKKRSRLRAAIATVLGAAAGTGALLLGLRAAGAFERLELAVYDHHMRLLFRDAPERDARVTLVEVTEPDIQALGRWPIPDGTLAQVIEQILGHGARAVGVDIYRDLPVEPGSSKLEEVVLRHPRAVFISKFADTATAGVGPPPVLAGRPGEEYRVGFNNMVTDRDGIVRRGVLLMENHRGETGFSFPLLLAMLYLADEGIYAEAAPGAPEGMKLGPVSWEPIQENAGSYVGADAGGQQFLIDYRGAAAWFPSVTLTDVVTGAANPELLRDRLVIFGLSGDSIPDVKHVAIENASTGSSSIAGAALHAYIASQILRYAHGEGEPIRTLGDGPEAAMILATALLGAGAGLWMRRIWRLALCGTGLLLGLWGAGWLALDAGWWIPVVPATAGGLVALGIVTAYLPSRERAERDEVMALFSRHVTSQVAEEVWRKRDDFLEGGRPRPERLTATILFADMKGYTGRAEKFDAHELMTFLNEYLETLGGAVLEAGGMVEDYFGDGLMACFGTPIARTRIEEIRDDARAAVAAALVMKDRVIALNTRWVEQGFPKVAIRVGIASGSVVAGSIGSKNRLKYAVVGDVVVTAERLESLDDSNHDFDADPGRILISEQTREYIGNAARTREVGQLRLKGKAELVLAHQVLDSGEDAICSGPGGTTT